ncbi:MULTISPECIES: signal recognition particle-docking protein FtsY [Methanobacterium]|uniref:Signal recognition particle receptor FtsY n=1 Tax=Methanobacterium veterum TaxID=408577 RepID=A0A9E4ZYS8_9EURY|nr:MULTISPECIES: signal recognition particle-docking protein FtsY [Methanobacterium]MCZ3366591.1 signal recognition particle-docking protein FtsY [Methanobacterium veterum]MCZ3374265.1 signal recognition particle-docking protein FtsY [Methanobacterium veterum]
MFESLKKKFSGTIGKLSDKLSSEEEAEETRQEEIPGETKETAPETTETFEKLEKIEEPSTEEKELETEEPPAEEKESETGVRGRLSGIFSREKKEEKVEEKVEEKPVETPEELEKPEEVEEEKSGMFSFVTKKTISEKDIDDILFELEMSLLESDVAMEVAEKIINSVKEDLVGRKIRRRSDVAEFTRDALKKAISEILGVETKDLKEMADKAQKSGEPLKIMFVGINGTGKTTTIAKVATYFINEGYTPVIAAADTFRAGAIEQITHHADNIGVKIIKHKKGADPAAVAYDAVEHAKAKGKEIVLIDTAGRMQTNVNLMDEMKKIKRVVKPDLIIYVGDSLTGNDAVEQASKFDEAVGVDGIVLTKADADAKGGAALSIGYVINKPILFLGVGQSYEDIMEFKPEWMVDQLV